MSGQAVVFNGDAGNLPLPDESVDLIVTSPPYWGLRAYKDGDETYDGQIGSEPTPKEFIDNLVTVTAELKRVLKQSGSMFVNLGDKYAGSGGHNNASLATPNNKHRKAGAEFLRDGPNKYNQSAAAGGARPVRAKSLMGLPWRYALACMDDLDLILREELIWDKPNHLPESAEDRCARAHEQFFHLTKSGSYYSAVDEIREQHQGLDNDKSQRGPSGQNRGVMTGERDEAVGNFARDRRGKLPGSVWRVPTEPLIVPEAVREMYNLPNHFAAFPTAWPYRLIKAFSPPAICLTCGEGRVPVVERTPMVWRDSPTIDGRTSSSRKPCSGTMLEPAQTVILGYACGCCPFTVHEGTGESSGRSYSEGVASGEYTSNDFGGRLADRPRVSGWKEWHLDDWTPPPSRPAVVLDPFGGTGTTAMVARHLGRIGINVDKSADYCRLAQWRIFRSEGWRKTRERELERSVLTFDL